MNLMLQWLKEQGGVEKMEVQNETKAAILYDLIDSGDFYQGTAQADHRSRMNVTFMLKNESLLDAFLKQAEAKGLYALKGHRAIGGARASIYNPMPVAGCQALADFMRDFANTNG